MSSCGVPITRVSLTPAPSDAGMPRRLRTTRAWLSAAMSVVDVFTESSGRCDPHLRSGRRPRIAPAPGTLDCAHATDCSAAASARRGIQPLQAPAAMDARIALEIRRNRRGADVLAARELRHGLVVEAEAAEIVGEIQHAVARQPGDWPRAAAARVRACTSKSSARLEFENVGGSQKIRSYSPRSASQPGHRIGLHQPVLACRRSRSRAGCRAHHCR